MPRVETNGVETFYERQGEGPPVVFVHGALVNRTTWAPQVEALAEEYTVVTYDVRGHGRTGGSSVAEYDVDLYVEDLRALVEALALERPALVGLSMGGLIAGAYAARYPEEVSGVVLADTFTPTIRGPGERLVRTVVLPGVVYPARLVGFERVERLLVWATERFSPGSAGEYDAVRRARAAEPPIPTAEFEKVVGSLARFREPLAAVDYGRIRVPVTVVYGDGDVWWIRRACAALAEAVPGADLVSIPDAGHAANVDNPPAFTTAVRDLLERAFPESGDGDGREVDEGADGGSDEDTGESAEPEGTGAAA